MAKNLNFGKYAIVNSSTYRLESEPDWFWKIKPATTETEIEVSKFLATETRKTENGFVTKVPYVTLELAIKEISLTFSETNIPGEDGSPILPKDAAPEIVEAVVRQMPKVMVIELWEAVGAACPGFGPTESKRTIVFENGEQKK